MHPQAYYHKLTTATRDDRQTVSLKTYVTRCHADAKSIGELRDYVLELNDNLPKHTLAYVFFSATESSGKETPEVDVNLGENARLYDVMAELKKIDGVKDETLVMLRPYNERLADQPVSQLSYWLASADPYTMEVIKALRLEDCLDGVYLATY